MRDSTHRRSRFMSPLTAAGLGALAMYLLDPDKGRRRRAVARDKAQSIMKDTRGMLDAASNDVRARMRGLEARRNRPSPPAPPDDLVLIERVRSRLGRVCSHPGALQVGALDGRVTLSGPILAREVDRVLGAVRAVPGVREIDEHLDVHEQAGSVPALQGDGRMRGSGALLAGRWSPAMRVAAVAGGGTLALAALRRGGVGGLALAGLGLVAALRGVTDRPLDRALGLTRRRAVEIDKSIEIDADPAFLYDLWRDFTNLPRFMAHVEEVRPLSERLSHWVVRGPMGFRAEWDAELTEADRPRRLSWTTRPGSFVQHVGTVEFEPAPRGARVHVHMSYNAMGALGHGIAKLLGHDPKTQMDEDLNRLKIFVERGAQAHDAARRDEPVQFPAEG